LPEGRPLSEFRTQRALPSPAPMFQAKEEDPCQAAHATLALMRTLILDPTTASLDELLERRKRSGLDRLDEVWEGVLHMVPAPSGRHGDIESQLHAILRPLAERAGLKMIGQSNLGASEHDYRVPDSSLHRSGASGTWHATAALAIEIVSPNDETWEKLPFYADHQVDEVLIVDPATHRIDWLALEEGAYEPTERSRLIELGPHELGERIEWPAEE
ncbi:MAG TPA: Uma2 family endonuclease, partial [Solirubrobacteraceae bacterium]|nr:Uma2 family endonuclease [Solirubrobacteraceae bacterium]